MDSYHGFLKHGEKHISCPSNNGLYFIDNFDKLQRNLIFMIYLLINNPFIINRYLDDKFFTEGVNEY